MDVYEMLQSAFFNTIRKIKTISNCDHGENRVQETSNTFFEELRDIKENSRVEECDVNNISININDVSLRHQSPFLVQNNLF